VQISAFGGVPALICARQRFIGVLALALRDCTAIQRRLTPDEAEILHEIDFRYS